MSAFLKEIGIEDFIDELPTNEYALRSLDGVPHVDFEEEEDTQLEINAYLVPELDMRSVYLQDEQEYHVLGGESG